MFIVWSGLGILAPIIVILGAVGVNIAANSIFGAHYSDGHSWVTAGGFMIGGLLCFFAGRALRKQGGSHSLFFIPMDWIGILAVLLSVPLWLAPSRNERKGLEEEVSGAPEPQTAAVEPQPPPATPAPSLKSPPMSFATVADAQREALRRYPDLGVANSDFNRRFVALYKQYQQSNPQLLQNPNWPMILANRVAGVEQ